MKFLYIFPHPDDESFGPAAAMHAQLAEGHEVHLLTLTRGGATLQRHRLGLSVEEMGEVRLREMLDVERVLGLTSMAVLDYPDNGLKDLDPRILERVVREYIVNVGPDVVVTYAVHGISGFHDHLVTHAVVKRVFVELCEEGAPGLRRLALLTLPDPGGSAFDNGKIRLKNSAPEDIDCEMPLTEADTAAMKAALSCYATYQETIEESGVIEKVGRTLYFEFFAEDCTPPVGKLEEGLG
ncbi:MAG: PIG-L family deacetylase [Bacteroidia bacterium]|nr:PIG-L family deacetylase [Bacteroidia bacterium]